MVQNIKPIARVREQQRRVFFNHAVERQRQYDAEVSRQCEESRVKCEAWDALPWWKRLFSK